MNATLTVQLVPAASEVPQLLDCVNCPEVEIFVIVSATVPRLDSVTGCVAVVVPTVAVPNARLVGETVMLIPVPASGTVCGLPVPLSVIVIDPVSAPVTVGTYFTVIVHFANAFSEAPHVVVIVKSPLGTMLVMLSVDNPVLVSVTDFEELVVPSCCGENARLAGERLTVVPPLLVPVPLSAAVCGLPLALSVIVSEPGWLPVAVGANVTLIVHCPPAAIDAEQVLVCAYGALAAMLLSDSEAVPEFVSVMVCAALVVLIA